jgi:hypothetical protein
MTLHYCRWVYFRTTAFIDSWGLEVLSSPLPHGSLICVAADSGASSSLEWNNFRPVAVSGSDAVKLGILILVFLRAQLRDVRDALSSHWRVSADAPTNQARPSNRHANP